MDSDEENDSGHEKQLFRNYPDLKLHQREIEELYLRDKDDENARYLLAVHHASRFFETIQGFHKGNLDLTGRFPERYARARSRWERFLADILGIMLHCREEVHERTIEGVTLSNGEPMILRTVDYVVELEGKWIEFEEKWHAHCGLYELYYQTQQTLAILAEYPVPKFQNLSLMQLPVEILDHVMALASKKQLNLLGNTCKALRELAERYTHFTQDIELECIPNYALVQQEDEDVVQSYLYELAQDERKATLKRLRYINKRPNILKSTRVISYSDEWQMKPPLSTNANDAWRFHAGLEPDFTFELEELLFDVISQCPNLRELAFRTITCWGIFFDRLRESPPIQSLKMTMCDLITPSCLGRDIQMENLNVFPLIANLELTFKRAGHFNQWSFLGFCGNLLSLCVKSMEKEGTRLPGASFRDRVFPFRTLERVTLSKIPQRAVASLSSWLNNTPVSHLPLTHLDITVVLGMNREHIFSLLDALSRASRLHTLFLSGLRYAEPDLISQIATKCPSIQVLSLVYWGQRRRGGRNPSNSILWPRPSHEYISSFAGFVRLRSFSWNLRYHRSGEDYSPRFITAFEDNYADEYDMERWDIDNGLLDEDTYLVRQLASVVPTLEIIVAQPSWSLRGSYWIKRGESDGRIVGILHGYKEAPEWVRDDMRKLDLLEKAASLDDWKFSDHELRGRACMD